MTGNEMKQIILSVEKGRGMKIVLKNEKEVQLFRQKIFVAGKYGIKISLVKVHGGPYGACVSKDGKQIGRVTKFTYGFTVGKWVGLALVKAGTVKAGDHVTLDWDVDAVVAPERRFLGK